MKIKKGRDNGVIHSLYLFLPAAIVMAKNTRKIEINPDIRAPFALKFSFKKPETGEESIIPNDPEIIMVVISEESTFVLP